MQETSTTENPSTPDTTDTTVSTPDTVVTTTDTASAAAAAPVAGEDTSSATPVDATTPVAVPAEAVAAAAPVATSPKKCNTIIQYGIAALIVAIMGVVLWYLLEEQGRVQTGVFDKAKALVLPAPAVATVNGERIAETLYAKNTAQMVASVQGQGLDPNDPTIAGEIKKQALDLLVNTEVLRQAAVASGVVVTSEQVEARYQEIVASVGDVETMATKMAELGITEESLRADIEGEILIQTYLDKAVDVSTVTVTEEEVKAMYDGFGASVPGAEVPALEELRPQIEEQIRYTKEQELVGAHIESLKGAADIEILI